MVMAPSYVPPFNAMVRAALAVMAEVTAPEPARVTAEFELIGPDTAVPAARVRVTGAEAVMVPVYAPPLFWWMLQAALTAMDDDTAPVPTPDRFRSDAAVVMEPANVWPVAGATVSTFAPVSTEPVNEPEVRVMVAAAPKVTAEVMAGPLMVSEPELRATAPE